MTVRFKMTKTKGNLPTQEAVELEPCRERHTIFLYTRTLQSRRRESRGWVSVRTMSKIFTWDYELLTIIPSAARTRAHAVGTGVMRYHVT